MSSLNVAARSSLTASRLIALAVSAVIVAISGCTAEPPATEASASPSAAAVDPKEWVPDEEISHRTYTDEELDQYRSEYLAEQAEDLESPAPDVELIRWTTTQADNSKALTECLTDAGFPAEPSLLGGASYEPPVPAAQEDALQLAWYTCSAKYTPVPALTTDWTPEQIGLAWDYWTEAFIPCLEAQGVPIPDEEVPSRQRYVDTFYTTDSRWLPTTWIYGKGEDADAVAEVCPPRPPHKYFYGS